MVEDCRGQHSCKRCLAHLSIHYSYRCTKWLLLFEGGGFYPKTRVNSTIINTNKAFYWSYEFKMILLKERLVKFK